MTAVLDAGSPSGVTARLSGKGLLKRDRPLLPPAARSESLRGRAAFLQGLSHAVT